MVNAKNTITLQSLLMPVAAMAFTMAVFFAFQMIQVMNDRMVLKQTAAQVEAPYAEAQKVNAQFGGLVVGTRKLADEGNEASKALVERLKQIGVIPEQPQGNVSPAPVPAARESVPPGAPVKP